MKEEKNERKSKWIKRAQIVVLALLLVYVAIVISRLVTLRSITHKQAKLANNANNFHMELRNTYTDGTNKTDVYYKDGKTMIKTENSESKSAVKTNSIIYQDEKETLFMVEYPDKTIVTIEDRNEGDEMVKKAPKRKFLDDLKYAMYHSIGKDNINGVGVYILNDDGKQRIINKKTGEPIKNITLEIGDYENIDTIEYNTVTDKDVARPDLTKCNEIRDYRNTKTS